jgi:hypothetical protein
MHAQVLTARSRKYSPKQHAINTQEEGLLFLEPWKTTSPMLAREMSRQRALGPYVNREGVENEKRGLHRLFFRALQRICDTRGTHVEGVVRGGGIWQPLPGVSYCVHAGLEVHTAPFE